MPEGCFVPEVYIVWIIRFVFVLMGIVVYIRIVYERFGGHGSWIVGYHLGYHQSSWKSSTFRILDLFAGRTSTLLFFTLLKFLYLSGGSIWVNALPDTLLKSNQRSLR